jgi:hypothetical protein
MRHSKHLDRVGRAEQQRACPVCGEPKTLRGLYGHLMMKHGKEGSELADLASNAAADPENDCQEIFSLTSRLLHVWDRLDLLDLMIEQDCFESIETRDLLRQSLNKQAEALIEALGEKGIVFKESENISALAARRVVMDSPKIE